MHCELLLPSGEEWLYHMVPITATAHNTPRYSLHSFKQARICAVPELLSPQSLYQKRIEFRRPLMVSVLCRHHYFDYHNKLAGLVLRTLE